MCLLHTATLSSKPVLYKCTCICRRKFLKAILLNQCCNAAQFLCFHCNIFLASKKKIPKSGTLITNSVNPLNSPGIILAASAPSFAAEWRRATRPIPAYSQRVLHTQRSKRTPANKMRQKGWVGRNLQSAVDIARTFWQLASTHAT